MSPYLPTGEMGRSADAATRAFRKVARAPADRDGDHRDPQRSERRRSSCFWPPPLVEDVDRFPKVFGTAA
jgi:hypothetical protein